MNRPCILVVDDDTHVLEAIRRDLRSRYRPDYRILSAGSGESALDAVRELKSRGDALAMLISDQRMPSMLGVELLARSRDVFPIARRVLLTAYSDIQAAIRGINEAHLDHYLEKPWDPPEQRLFPVVDDLLDSWNAERQPETSGLRLVGHPWSPQSHQLREFLASNLVPYRWLDIEKDAEARRLAAAMELGSQDLPALFLESGKVLRHPDPAEVAGNLGLSTIAAHDLYDLVIVGAGPAGLAAGVYGASEGLRTLLLEGHGPGGQAAASMRIENYLGFPSGVSGSELTRRAVLQAQRLGAELLAPVHVTGLSVENGYKKLRLADGRTILARALIAATGMRYREHEAAGIAELTGAGVYYGAAATESQYCRGRHVFVAGGGNSAGQCAVYLSGFASGVSIVIRKDSLSDSMSQYLIEQCAARSNIRVLARTAIDRVEGAGRLERVWLKSTDDGRLTAEDADALFIFIGTKPISDWLPPSVLRNDKGFVLTGRDTAIAGDFAKIWKEQRDPLPLETSEPGIFAAGDVRAGAINRVASAVGEGAMAVRLVGEYIART